MRPGHGSPDVLSIVRRTMKPDIGTVHKETAMFNLLSRYRRERAGRELFARARLESDPLSHPELRNLSPRDLADIAYRVGRN